MSISFLHMKTVRRATPASIDLSPADYEVTAQAALNKACARRKVPDPKTSYSTGQHFTPPPPLPAPLRNVEGYGYLNIAFNFR